MSIDTTNPKNLFFYKETDAGLNPGKGDRDSKVGDYVLNEYFSKDQANMDLDSATSLDTRKISHEPKPEIQIKKEEEISSLDLQDPISEEQLKILETEEGLKITVKSKGNDIEILSRKISSLQDGKSLILDIDFSHRPLSESQFIQFCRENGSHILSLSLPNISPEAIIQGLAECQNIKSLSFPAFFEVDSSIIKTLNHHCPSLETLNLAGTYIWNDGLNFLNLPNLKNLNIFLTINIGNTDWESFACIHKKIEHLEISLNRNTEESILEGLKIWKLKSLNGFSTKFFPYLKELEYLKISSEHLASEEFNDQDLDLIAKNCKNLKELKLIGIRAKGEGLEKIAVECPLEKFTMLGCHEIEEGYFAKFADKCEKLHYLKLSGVGVDLDALRAFKIPLKTLILENFDKLIKSTDGNQINLSGLIDLINLSKDTLEEVELDSTIFEYKGDEIIKALSGCSGLKSFLIDGQNEKITPSSKITLSTLFELSFTELSNKKLSYEST